MRRKKTEPARQVFYCRLSSMKNSSESFENQIQMLQEKWPGDYPVYKEVVSGAGKRRVLMDLVRTLPKGSTIYAVHVDRLSRKGIYDLLWIMNEAREKGIILHTLHDGVLDKEQEIILALRAFAAEQERLNAKRRIHDQIEAAKRQGKAWGVYKAKENNNFRWGTKPINQTFQQSIPRFIELRKNGKSYEEIAKIFHKETGETISVTHLFRLVKRAWGKESATA